MVSEELGDIQAQGTINARAERVCDAKRERYPMHMLGRVCDAKNERNPMPMLLLCHYCEEKMSNRVRAIDVDLVDELYGWNKERLM